MVQSVALGIGALLLVVATTPIASAYGYSPYDTGMNAQGYQCHHLNTYGECSDWSSYDLNRALPGSIFSAVTSRPVERCQSPMLDCTGRVTVRVRPIPTTPRRGEIVTYTLYIRNDDSQTRSVYVRANLDPNMSFESASDGYQNDSRLVRWNMQMEPWSSTMLIIRARVERSAPYDSELRLLVQAGSSADTSVVRVEDTRIEDRARFLVGTQYYPDGAVAAPFIRKPNHDSRNYYYDLDHVRQYRVYGRTETNYPFSSSYYCDPRYYSCEKRP